MDSLTSSSILLRVIADNNLKSLYGGFGGPYRFFAKIQVHLSYSGIQQQAGYVLNLA